MTVPDSNTNRETLSIDDLATTLGIHRTTAYELARRDQLPIPVIRLGRRMVVSRRALDELLQKQQPSNLGEEGAL